MITKIGITGHQKLSDPADWNWTQSALSRELDTFKNPVTAVSSLAIGVDQLFASLVVKRGGKIYVVVPFKGYERTFSSQDIKEYNRLLCKAHFIETLQTEGADEDKYLSAGKHVVELSDLMISVWDGKPAQGKGGTADIVDYALTKNVPLIHINPANKSITRQQQGK